MSAFVLPGGNDVPQLNYGTESWSISAPDSVLQLGSAWNQAEFNVVGNTDGSRADFNAGASINVKLLIADGTSIAPTCVGGIATTRETNNLNLRACQTGVSIDPYIEYTEAYYLALPPNLPPIPITKPLQALD